MFAMSLIIVFVYRCYRLSWKGKKVREGQRVSSEQSIRQEGLRAWSQFFGRNFYMETHFSAHFQHEGKSAITLLLLLFRSCKTNGSRPTYSVI